jgi:2-(3-amino-3-carboxypropyl)histidine synthase
MAKGDYDFEIDRVVKEIKKNKAKYVGLEFPEGLKVHAVDVAKAIEEKTGAATVIFIDSVYGACDTKEKDAVGLGLDMTVHFGHTDMKPKLCK